MFPLRISFTNSLRQSPVQGYNSRKNTYKRYSHDTSDLIVEQCHEGQEDSDRSQTRHPITPRKKVDKCSLMYRDSIRFDWIGSVLHSNSRQDGKNLYSQIDFKLFAAWWHLKANLVNNAEV